MASSVTSRGKANKKTVIHQLSDLFGSVLNLQIIESVAHSCNYNVEMSSHHLLEMTSSIDNSIVANGDSEQSPVKHSQVSSSTVEAIPNSVSDGFLNQNVVQSQALPTINSDNVCQKQKDIERVVRTISQGYRILILMRGLPGSGKSHLAKFIIDSTIGQGNYKDHVFSTDDYFMKNGRYIFEPTKLSEAHGWNHNRALKAMSQGVSPVIIDNTNTQLWEMRPYAMMAVDYGYYIEILEPNTPWCSNVRELTRRNKHGVARQGISDMLLRYQKNVTGLNLLCAYNLRYAINKPPMFRNQPPLTYGSNWSSCSNLASSIQSLNDPSSKFMSALSSSLPQINEMPTIAETVNLMDFNEDSIKSPSPTNKPIIIEDDDDVHIVDDILTCSPVNESNILKPDLVSSTIPSDEQARKSNSSFSLEKSLQSVEKAWGIDEQALHSWDIVMPIKDVRDETQEQVIVEEVHTPVEIKESSSNTEVLDFDLPYANYLPSGFRILYARNRDINEGISVKNRHDVPKKLKLDKSCSVDYADVDVEMADSSEHMEHLESLFPTIPKKYLIEIYQKCKGDLNWTVDVLLESKIYIDDESDDEVEVVASRDPSPKIEVAASSQKETVVEANQNNFETISFQENDESNVDVRYDQWSESAQDWLDSKNETRPEIPSSSSAEANCNMEEPVPSTSRDIPSPQAISIYSDSDTEFDSDKSDTSETIELNLGDVLINQLEKRFEAELPGYPKGFQPIVQIPVSLAKQLFALYLESVYQQQESQNKVLDGLMKQDEEFAKKLDEQERKNIESQKENAMSFQEIMDEQVAQNLHNADVNQWKNLTPDTLAAKMTRQKLFSSFPTLDRNVIVEILHAHDNDYGATVETLLNSAPKHCINGSAHDIKQLPISEEVVSEMKQDIQNCAAKDTDNEQTAEQYRQEAQTYLSKRNELYQKAQNYFQRGMMEVAQFYSDMARKQTNLFEQANSLAATSFVNEHAKRLQSFDTLDLHYLHAKEAIPVLDIFIDRHINLLRGDHDKSSQQLMIITGRGKNSKNGVSTLKPIVIGRLKKRDINYYQLNPGLLKIKISKNSLMTSDIP